MRRRAIAGVVALVCVAGFGSSATGLLGSRNLSPAAAPARVVVAASGYAGIFTVRDGALTRLDVQAPPGRLMIPPPKAGPVANAITVGATRVWIARGRTLFGYTTDENSLVPVWTTSPRLGPGQLQIASIGTWLWAAVSGGRAVRQINVREPMLWSAATMTTAPRLRPTVAMPAAIVGLAATPVGVWVLMRTATGGSEVAELRIGRSSSQVKIIATSRRAPIAISSLGGLLCVLVRGQVIWINPIAGVVVKHISVPGTVRTVSVNLGHVVVTVPSTGEVLDISLESPAVRQLSMVSAPVRALVATRNGFWASTGRNATPTNYLGL